MTDIAAIPREDVARLVPDALEALRKYANGKAVRRILQEPS
jgi:hypothetical protein